jgi:trimeric autotransporter adhesin
MADIVVSGNSSGSVTLRAPDVSGTTILTLPTTTGTLVVTGGAQTIEFADGTVSAPSITNSGDTNTGIFFPAADTIAFTEGGVESMRIDSAGNVGIGTSSPERRLHLRAPTTCDMTIQCGNTTDYSYLYFGDSASATQGWVGYYNTEDSMRFGTNNAERMRIDSSGNVGIGTSSPQAPLDVSYGNASRADTLRLTNTNTAGYGSWLNFYGNYNGGYSFAKIGTENDGTGGSMRFHTADTSEVSQERMRITSAGRVGIGTTSPNRALHVATGVLTLGNSAGALFTDTNNAGVLLGSDNAIGYISGVTAAGTGTAKLLLQPFGDEVLVAATTDNGAYNLQCNGTGVWGAGAYVNGSDERIKENIAPLDSGLDVIAKLNPVTYKYKKTWSKDQSTQTGFIAQELLVALEGQNYVDGVVQQGGSESYYSVAYQNIIPILTKAIQEQQTIITDLKARIETLENK